MTVDTKRWQSLTFAQQLANIGSEVARACSWQDKGDVLQKEKSAERALELIDSTVADPRWTGRYNELLRLREVFCDVIFGHNVFHTSASMLENYFLPFALRAIR